MNRKAIIISISGKSLTKKEKELLKDEKPWGLILFKRNIINFDQTCLLIKSIRKVVNDKNFPILVDEEGGTVCRLSAFLDNRIYSQKFFGDLFGTNKGLAISLYKNYISSMCSVLKLLGININTVPVLDVLKKKSHKIIGTRSYSEEEKTIKSLASICIKEYKKNKISNVIKHIPGHGSSLVDSHKKLPIVKTSNKELSKVDFNCFKNSNSLFAMTAHIIYHNIDPNHVATHSKIVIKKIIRKKIGFKGILISDDISMKALKYDLITNAQKSLEAGCNLVLYCSGNYSELKHIIKHIPLIDAFTIKKTSEFYKFLS